MMSKTTWLLRNLVSQLWVRVALFAAAAVVVALVAAFVPFEAPQALSEAISAKVVDELLSLLAGAMLSVTTFSLGVMVSAFATTASSGTPRATQLVMADSAAQNALSIFLGAFIYALVGVIALSLGAYGPSGRVILFFATIAVVALIVVSLIRWIQLLSQLGRLSTTVEYVETAARDALLTRARTPCLGARCWSDGVPPQGARPVSGAAIGHVQMIDVERLSDLAERQGVEAYINALPGDFVHPGRPLIYAVGGEPGDEALWSDAFVIAEARTYAQDPRFGLIVLGEIASRALSPAVNDPGTAINILGRAVGLLALWRDAEPEDELKALFPRLHAPALAYDELFEDVFRPIARDGAGVVEVQLRLQVSLRALHDMGGAKMKAAARRQSREALERAQALPIAADRETVAARAAWSAER